MKAIVVSETAFEAIRDQLIVELTKGAADREARVKSGDMTGMALTPEALVNNRVHRAFDQLKHA